MPKVCLFCLDIVEGQTTIVLNCNCKLIFHDECMHKWLNFTQIPQCPLCRRDLNYISDSQIDVYDDYISDSEYCNIQPCYILIITIMFITFALLLTYDLLNH